MGLSRAYCHRCDTPSEIAGPISKRGLCEGCATSALVQSHIDMRTRSGRHYERWLAGMLRRFGAEVAEAADSTQAPV